MRGNIYLSDPEDGCKEMVRKKEELKGDAFYIVRRGGCDFVDKVLHVQEIGGKMAIIVDDTNEVSEEIIMSDDGNGFKVNIPSVLIGK